MFTDPFASLDIVVVDYDSLKDNNPKKFNNLMDSISTDPLSSAKLMANRRGDVDEKIKNSVASDAFASRQYILEILDPNLIPNDVFSAVTDNTKFVFELSLVMTTSGFEIPNSFVNVLSKSPANSGAITFAMIQNGMDVPDSLLKSASKNKYSTIQIAEYLEYTNLPKYIKNSVIRHVPYKYYTMNMYEVTDAELTKIEKSLSKMTDVRRKSKYNRFTAPKIATLINYIKKSGRFPESFEEYFISDPMYINDIVKFNVDLVPHRVLDVHNKYKSTIKESTKFDYYYALYSAD